MIVEELRGEPIERSIDVRVVKRGWPAVRDQLPAFVRHLHYRTEVDALAVLVDADYSVVHTPAHELSAPDPAGRRCELRGILGGVFESLTPIAGKVPTRTAVGVAVPAIEAWLLAGIDPRASEAAWLQARQENRFIDMTRSLKVAAYGAATVGEGVAIPRARQLILDALRKGDLLRECFPAGFGAFADDILGW